MAQHIGRRGVVVGAGLATVLAGPARAQGARYRLRYGTAFPADHPGAKRIVEAAALVAKDTNGLVELHVFPDGQLGSEAEMFGQVLGGMLDFASTSGVNQTVVPAGGINAVAYAFPSYQEVWPAMDGDLGNYVRAQFAKAGLHVMPRMLDNGFRQVTTNPRQVAGPADLKGLRMRVPGNQLWISLFTALGAVPVSLDFGGVYAALQTRMVDGEENPLALIDSAKLFEVQRFVALTGHIWDGHHIFANTRRWNELPDEVRDVLTRRLSEAALNERQDIVALNAQVQDKLTQAGLRVDTPDKAPFREVLASFGFYQEWHQRFGDEAWGHLVKFTGPL